MEDFGSAASGSPSGGEDIDELKREVAEEETTQLNVEIPAGIHRRLKIHSVQTGREMKEIVRELLDSHLPE